MLFPFGRRVQWLNTQDSLQIAAHKSLSIEIRINCRFCWGHIQSWIEEGSCLPWLCCTFQEQHQMQCCGTGTFIIPSAKAQRPISPAQSDLAVPPTLLNLICNNYRNSRSRAGSLANSRHQFFTFVIFEVNKHFQGLKPTLIFLEVQSFFICHSRHLLSSSAAGRDAGLVTPSLPETLSYHLWNHDTVSSFFQLTLKEMLPIFESSFPSEMKLNYCSTFWEKPSNKIKCSDKILTIILFSQ